MFALAIAGLFSSPAWAAAADEADTVHILLVIDMDSYGAYHFGFDRDEANMVESIDQAMRSQGLAGRYRITILKGKDVKPEKVLEYYRDVKIKKKDVLLFYYTGHGMTDSQKGHMLTMSGGHLERSKLRQVMLQKEPRLAVILTDCCATQHGAPRRVTERIAPLPLPKAKPDKEQRPGLALRHLLFRHTGVVDIQASLVGQGSTGRRQLGGSYFTAALTSLWGDVGYRLDIDGDGFVEWSELFAFVQQRTEFLSTVTLDTHTPEAFSLGQRVKR